LGDSVVVEYLLGQSGVVESGRRDRGVGIGSKMTLVQTRHERGEQLAFAHCPFGSTPHDGLRVHGVRPSKKMPPVPQRSHHIRRSKA
jgi:hypothetical protein